MMLSRMKHRRRKLAILVVFLCLLFAHSANGLPRHSHSRRKKQRKGDQEDPQLAKEQQEELEHQEHQEHQEQQEQQEQDQDQQQPEEEELHPDLRTLLKAHDHVSAGSAPSHEHLKFKALNGATPNWLNKMRCREIRQPPYATIASRSTCCLMDETRRPEDNELSRIKCLPSFIIGGTQKSGTTVLSAYLASHPAVSFPWRKEAHYFSDGRKRRALKINDYFKSFELWNYTDASIKGYGGAQQPKINGEATPYYLASRESCSKIAATLPHLKFIVLMREPVPRAWSEYQMKKRRVEAQNDFVHLCVTHASAIHSCLLRASAKAAGKDRWSFITDCVPPVVTAHVNWAKLKAMISSRALNASSTWEKAVESCFTKGSDEGDSEVESENEASIQLRHRRLTASSRNNSAESKAGGGRSPNTQSLHLSTGYRNYHASEFLSTGHATYNASAFSSLLALSKPVPPVPQQGTKRRQLRGEDASLAIPAASGGSDAQNTHFHAARCLEKHAKESLISPHRAFVEEVRDFKKCAGPLLDGTLSNLDKAVEKCIKIRVGIANNYVYRSLYAVQLHHCLKSIPRENVLIFPSELLQREPMKSIQRVLTFLGLPMVDAVKNLALKQEEGQSSMQEVGLTMNATFISEAVRAHFPKFELTTGWSPVGVQSYEAMNATHKQELQSFFEPYNQMLFDLLEEDWSKVWEKKL